MVLVNEGFTQFPFNIINLIMVIMAAETFTSEFSNGTIKILLSGPFSRLQVFFSKLVNLLLIYILLNLIAWIVTIIMSLTYFNDFSFHPSMWSTIENLMLGNLLYLLVIVPAVLLISNLAKGPALATVIGVIGMYLAKVIALVLDPTFINWHIMSWAKWNPFNILMINFQLSSNIYASITQLSNAELSAGCVIYGIIFIWLAYLIFNHKNI